MHHIATSKIDEIKLQQVRKLDHIDARISRHRQNMPHRLVASDVRRVALFHEFDACNHGIGVLFGEALVLGEGVEVADVGAAVFGGEDGVGEIGHVSESQVQALAGEGVDTMRRIPNQRHPVPNQTIRMRQGQRKSVPLGVKRINQWWVLEIGPFYQVG